MSNRKLTLFAALLLIAVSTVLGVNAYDKAASSKGYHFLGGDDPYPRVVSQAFAYIERQYVEPKRANPAKMLEGAFKSLETRFPPVRIDQEAGGAKATVKVGESVKVFNTQPATTLDGVSKVLKEVLDFVSKELSKDEKKEDVYYAALNGAVSELDPHSNAINPAQFKEFMIGTRGSFGGIGFVFGIRKGEMAVITPIEGTPAARAGLRSGDRIVMIDGEPTINMPVDIAASKMRGDPGTQVTLLIARSGWSDPKSFTFTREVINVQSVESYTLKGDGKAPTVFLRVKNFQKDTADELKKGIAEAQAKNPDLAGVIIDLRNDPGGLLDQAIELSDGFMDRGVIVSTRGRDVESQSRSEATNDEPFTKLPVVVLINQGSASASEIVAGALRSYRALLIGTKTFGKGSVQKLFPLPDNGALKLTVAQYLTANDVSIQSIGIQPDILTYPAVVENKGVRIGAPIDHMAEADLKNAFTEWGNSSEKPWRELQYLAREQSDSFDSSMGDEDDEEAEETPAEAAPKKSFAELPLEEKHDRLKKNFPVELARRVLSKVPEELKHRTGREELKKIAGPVLDEVAAEQMDKLSQAMSKVGLDWSSIPGEAEPKLTVRVETPKEFSAGEKQKMLVVVKNEGTVPAYRIWGRTDSKNPLMGGRDFIFGKIDPGQERGWQATIDTPKSVVSRWDPVNFEVHSNGKKLTVQGEGAALVKSTAKPEFAYNYTMTDINEQNPALSGNGILDAGDLVELHLTVENIGHGKGKAVEVNIRAEGTEQIILKNARHRLENFEPATVRYSPMSFKVNKADDENRVRIVVSVTDTEFNAAMSDELKFMLGQPYQAKARRAQPVFKFSQLPPLRTTKTKLTLPALVEDDGAVKEVYAYVGDKKVYYYRGQEPKKQLEAKISLELKPGSNFVVVAAKDDQELVARKTFNVFLAESGQELALVEKRRENKAAK